MADAKQIEESFLGLLSTSTPIYRKQTSRKILLKKKLTESKKIMLNTMKYKGSRAPKNRSCRQSSTRISTNELIKTGSKRSAEYENSVAPKKICNNITQFNKLEWIENLLNFKPQLMLTTLLNSESGLKDFLSSSPIKTDILISIMKVLKKVCEADADSLRNQVISYVVNSDLLLEIKKYAMLLIVDSDHGSNLDVTESFICNSLILLKYIIATFPTQINERLKSILISLKYCVRSISGQEERFNYIFQQLENIICQVNSYIEINEQADCPQQIENENFLHTGSINFREMQLVPTKEDLICDKPFLRKNLKKGSYKDVEHYLDVQFRLLREDFIATVRLGISEYIESLTLLQMKCKYSNVQIYSKVKFTEIRREKNRFVTLLCFDCDNKFSKNVNWKCNKIFMNGSLLLITKDCFKTFSIATVVGRNITQLKNGIIGVTFVPGTDITDILNCDTYFVMAESMVYYEAYHPVLSALKEMNENNFPMKQHIVSVCLECSLPAYLSNLTNESAFNIMGFKVDLLKNDSWPTADQLKLNESQHQALKKALTNDLAVIQGPPGTGKTFLSLKLVEVLLKNKVFIDSPIIVICYSYHALDQFLEGILKYTKKLVRIGNQSENEALQNYNIGKIRDKWWRCCRNSNRTRHQTTNDEFYLKKNELEDKINDIQTKINHLEDPNGILHARCLLSVMSHRHQMQLIGKETKWLLGSDIYRGTFIAENSTSEENDPIMKGKVYLQKKGVIHNESDDVNKHLDMISDKLKESTSEVNDSIVKGEDQSQGNDSTFNVSDVNKHMGMTSDYCVDDDFRNTEIVLPKLITEDVFCTEKKTLSGKFHILVQN